MGQQRRTIKHGVLSQAVHNVGLGFIPSRKVITTQLAAWDKPRPYNRMDQIGVAVKGRQGNNTKQKETDMRSVWRTVCWVGSLVLGLGLVGTTGCYKMELEAPEMKIEETNQALAYGCTLYSTNGETHRSRANLQSLWNGVESYCTEMWQARFGRSCIGEFDSYRKYSCAADVFMEMVNGVEKANISIRQEWMPPDLLALMELQNEDYTCFDHLWTPPEVTDTANPGIIYKAEFDYLETPEQRSEILHLALLAYERAMHHALNFANIPIHSEHGTSLRAAHYSTCEDLSLSGPLPEISNNGAVFAEQMFASFSSMAAAMTDIKQIVAEDALGLGVLNDDEWTSEEYGRIPALRHIFGTLWDIDESPDAGPDWAEDWQVPPLSFFPDNAPIMEMSNQLRSAMTLVDRYLFTEDNENSVESYVEGLDVDAKEGMVRAANNSVFCPQMNCYFSIAELVQAYNTTEQMLDEAVKYMYAHMMSFPRRPSKNNVFPIVQWDSPLIVRPMEYLLRDFNQDFYSSFFIELLEQEQTIPMEKYKKVGIVAISKYWRERLLAVIDGFGVNRILDDIADPNYQNLSNDVKAIVRKLEGTAEEQGEIQKYLAEAIKVFDDVLGEKKVKYTIDDVDNDGNFERTFTFVNPVVRDDQIYDHLRLIPVYTVDEGHVHELRHLACNKIYHNYEYNNRCRYATGAALTTFEESCAGEFGLPCATSATAGFNGADLGNSKYYVVEHKVAESVSDGSDYAGWQPIGVVSVQNDHLEEEWLYFEGKASRFARKIASVSGDNVSDPSCNPINGLDTQCLKNWVPAIDNEVVDPDNGQYETSYVHYLDMARTAAGEAKRMREALMDNIIEEAHGQNLADAQFQQALDQYIAGIREICGDSIEIDFATWAKEAKLLGLGPGEFEAYLTNHIDETDTDIDTDTVERLYKEYGCEFASNPYLENPDELPEDSSANTGEVHCAVDRNCSITEPTNLGQLGVFTGSQHNLNWYDQKNKGKDQLSMSEESAMHKSQLLMETSQYSLDAQGIAVMGNTPVEGDYECDEEFEGAEVMDPIGQGIFDLGNIDENNYETAIFSAMERIYCWAKNYRSYVQGFISEEQVYYLPDIFKNTTGSDHLLNPEINDPTISSYGDYFTTLQQIGKTITDIRSAAESYVYEFESIMAKVKTVEDSMQKSAIELLMHDWQIAWQLQANALQTALYKVEPYDRTVACINSVDNQFGNGGPFHFGIVLSWIYALKANLENEDDYLTTKELASDAGGMFVEKCLMAGNFLFGQKKGEICNSLLKNYFLPFWGEGNSTGKGFPRIPEHEGIPRNMYSIVPKKVNVTSNETTNWNGVPRIEYMPEPMISKSCELTDAAVDGIMAMNDWSMDPSCNVSNKMKDVCYDNNAWFTIEGIYYIAQYVHEEMKQNMYKSCDSVHGCEVSVNSDSGEAAISNCGGLGQLVNFLNDNWAENWDEQMELYMEEAAYLNDLVHMDNFVEQMLVTSRNLAMQRHEVSNLVRTLAQQIGQLSQLEERQIALFRDFVNAKNVADASSLSSVAEWNERYDFRRKAYKKQLQRARIAAWIARRAIEFRFGINLSHEYVQTIFGEPPSAWADMIYDTHTSKCGETPEEDESGTAITGCLTPEEQIEDYVQNLEDYVASYGNTPGQGWWFHEDDATGVISIRDHLAITHVEPSKSVGNLLFFSEEFDMDTDMMNTNYDEIAVDLTNPESNFTNPSTWEKTESLSIAHEELENPIMGLPSEVVNAHFTNEWGVYEDQMDDFTADHLQSEPGVNAWVAQTVDLDQAERDIGAITYDDTFGYNWMMRLRSKAAFATYLRQYPRQTPNDCEAGEVFFPAIGRCGVECEEDADCETDQVCMAAGRVRDNETDELLEAGMCNWCTADRACIGQDGSAVELGLAIWHEFGPEKSSERGPDDPPDPINIVRAKVPAHAAWSKQSVNTINNIEYRDYEYDEIKNIRVDISNTTTENLVLSSERVDEEKGWEFNTIYGTTTSPDGVSGGAVVLTGAIADPEGSYVDIFAVHPASITENLPAEEHAVQITGSIWLKYEGGGSENPELELYVDDGGWFDLIIGRKRVDFVEDSEGNGVWRRYEVSGTYHHSEPLAKNARHDPNLDITLSFLDTVDTTRVAVWGAQIEMGTTTATPYIPTGKNLIPDSSDFSDWTFAEQLIEPSEDKGPAGTGNVFQVNDDSSGWVSTYLYLPCDFDIGDTYTYSIWIKSADGDVHNVGHYFQQLDADLNECDSVPGNTSAGDSWQRTVLTDTISDCSSGQGQKPSYIRIALAPEGGGPAEATGSILAFGPQLEKGAYATGYQETRRVNLLAHSNDLMKWAYGSDLDIEPVGDMEKGMVNKLTAENGQAAFADYNHEFQEGEQYTASVWVKNAEPGVSNLPRIYVYQWDPVAGEYTSIQFTYTHAYDDRWERYEHTTTITRGPSGNLPAQIRVAVYPTAVEGHSSVLVYGPQLERGPMATEYQPTGIYYPQLMADGDMEASGTDAWDYNANYCQLSKIFGAYFGSYALRIEEHTAGEYPYAYNYPACPIMGKEYQVSGLARGDGTCAPALAMTGQSDMWIGSSSTEWQSFNVFVTATNPSLVLKGTGGSSGRWVDFDDVVVTETNQVLLDGNMEMGDVSMWVPENNASLSKQSAAPDAGSALRVAFTDTTFPYASQGGLTVGKTYRISGKMRGDGTTGPQVWWGEYAVGTSSTDWQRLDATFVAAYSEIRLYSSTDAAGYAEFDDLRLIEIDDGDVPLSSVDSYTKDWGLDVAAVGAQLTPISTFPCDANGEPWLDRIQCEQSAANNIHSCCQSPENWNTADNITPYQSYIECQYCATGDADLSSQITDAEKGWRSSIGDVPCSDEQYPYVNCDPSEICAGYDNNDPGLRCPHDPPGYVRNTYLREHYDPGFNVEKVVDVEHPLPDELHAYLGKEARARLFKEQFQYVYGTNEQPGYYVYRFRLDIDAIERGNMGQFGLIAPNNFNYRMRTFAANVVGIDAIDCTMADDPLTCAANPWLVYDLKQMGQVRIRNHHKELSVEAFNIPTGRISGGQAWAAEQVIGFPISGAHQGALAQIQRVALMGRPMQGMFEFRLYDTPEMVWNNVEDIQLILGYHFWTRSE
ncbi:MAG: hypothetical protein QNJ97_20465 [Myxococcota bacterium]|nr:hypothetical protein [Myxococcota bacterium]